MKTIIITFLLTAATLAQQTNADCLVQGDMLFTDGQSTGSHIGLQCLNSTHYDAKTTLCDPTGSGNLIEGEAVFSCPGSAGVPYYCVQCGPRGLGAALCLSTPDTPSHCSANSNIGGDGSVNDVADDDAVLIGFNDDNPTTTGDGGNGNGDDEGFLPIEGINPNGDDDNMMNDQIACTMDVDECPDGTYVSRIPPDCEFEPCPSEDKLVESLPTVDGDGTNVAIEPFDLCDNAADLSVWQTNGGEVGRRDAQIFCARKYKGTGCLGSGFTCIEECFQEVYGYSVDCSTCFADVPQCSLGSGCMAPCQADLEGAECQGCTADCIEKMFGCTGLPRDAPTTIATTVSPGPTPPSLPTTEMTTSMPTALGDSTTPPPTSQTSTPGNGAVGPETPTSPTTPDTPPTPPGDRDMNAAVSVCNVKYYVITVALGMLVVTFV